MIDTARSRPEDPGPVDEPESERPVLRVVDGAFEAFHRSQRDHIARSLALTVRSTTLGAEAADEAFLIAYRDWSSVSTMSNPAGWIYRVGLNWARGQLRRHKRETFGDAHDRAHLDRLTDPDLDAALARLSVEHRSAVVLRHLLGHSERETAEILDIPPGTVKSRLSRALEQLRDDLKGER